MKGYEKGFVWKAQPTVPWMPRNSFQGGAVGAIQENEKELTRDATEFIPGVEWLGLHMNCKKIKSKEDDRE